MSKTMRVAGSMLLATIVAAGIALVPQKQVAATGDVTIDETNFPDECFRREWVEFYDKNSDGVLSEEEASAVEEIDTSFKSTLITDLKGIEYFTEITELNCNSNDLTSLDVSKNTKLKRLYCGATKLTSLDVSKNTELQGLFCGSNGLTSLDVSKNVNLTALECSYNELTSLDISQNTKLESLYCSGNQLTSLDISQNTKLESLYCNDNQLTNLDVSMLADLDMFDCSENQLDSLDLSKNAKLRKFDCNNTKLTSLDVSKNVDLAFFYCNGNELTELNIYNNKKLIDLNCSDNQLSSLYVSHLTNLKKIDCSRNRLKSLDIGKKDKLMFLYCYGNEIKDLNVKDAYFINLLCIYHTGNEETKDGIKIYRYYDDNGGIEIISELEIDLFTKMWTDKIQPTPTPTPAPNSVSIEIDLSKGEIPYTDNQALLDAVSALLKKCEEDGLFGVTIDNVNQIIHMDLDNNGEDDVDYLLVGYTFLRKTDTCSIRDAIAFTETQLKGTAYKSITFVCNQYHIVTFDANGGSGEMEPERAFAGRKYVLPNCEFTAPKGMEFDSWDLGLEGEAVDITADTVVKAQWKKILYAVKVTTDGNGSATASVDSGETGTEVTLKAEPNEGYKFKEWQVISGGVTITDNKFTIGEENVEIKAIFETLSATPDPEKEPSIADFVERLYTIALNRASEPEGKAFWVKEIEDGNRTGGDCAYFFLIESPEFKNRGLSDEDFVETLYKTFFDRESEAEGKAFWVGQLKNKTMTRDQVIMGFIDSKEWCNVCATYGVKSGAPTAKAEIASKNAIAFATRLYTCCLGREAEEGGLKYWSLALTNLEQTGCSAAKEFFTGEEFVNLKLKDEEYIRRLYTTFMDREPKAEEVAYWTGEIAKGNQTRESVLAFFGSSEEFTNICKKYGIDRGTI